MTSPLGPQYVVIEAKQPREDGGGAKELSFGIESS